MRYQRVVLLSVTALAGCSSSDSVLPNSPSLELVNIRERHGADNFYRDINAHIYGSFRVGASGSKSTVIASGPANFPGSPPGGAGTCSNGTWYNAQGKATSGSLTKPHPHCIKPEAAIEIVLEPITACYSDFPNGGASCPDPGGSSARLVFGRSSEGAAYRLDGIDASTEWYGAETPIVAYAIDATTLGTTNHRVGTLSIDFTQYQVFGVNYFANMSGGGSCIVGTHNVAYPCLNKVISTTYQPLPSPDGLGPSDATVEGFLWFQPASTAFNYSDDEWYYIVTICRQQFADRYTGGTFNVNIFDISSLADAQSYCVSVQASDVIDCMRRLGVIAAILPASESDPCLPAV
jgi:hypothetical protein